MKLNHKTKKNFKKFIIDYFKDWTVFQTIWLISFIILDFYLFFVMHDTVIGLIASVTGIICVILTSKVRISNYYFGIIQVVLYAYIAFQNRYYGEVILNLVYFLPMCVAGIYYWYKNRDQKKIDTALIKKINTKEVIFWFLLSAIAIIVYGLILKSWGGQLPFVDASSTVLSITGMILTVRRAKEQWIIWIIGDIVSISMWVYVLVNTGNDVSILIMWVAFLTNAFYGYYNWRKIEKTEPARFRK